MKKVTRARGIAQEVEHLPSNLKALNTILKKIF
jgi:hypothetical protein